MIIYIYICIACALIFNSICPIFFGCTFFYLFVGILYFLIMICVVLAPQPLFVDHLILQA